MNKSLTLISFKESLTSRLIDYSNVYFLPVICLFGILTSICCLIVSGKKDTTKIRNASNLKFITVNSLMDFIYLLTQFFIFIIRCGALCPFSYTYTATFYQTYVFWFLGYTVINAQVLFGIFMAYDRLRMLTKRRKSTKFIYSVSVVCIVISVFLNVLPYIVFRKIDVYVVYQSQNTTEFLYHSVIAKNFQTSFFEAVQTVILTIKDPFLFLVFCFVNSLVCLKFKQHMNKKMTLLMNGLFSFIVFKFI